MTVSLPDTHLFFVLCSKLLFSETQLENGSDILVFVAVKNINVSSFVHRRYGTVLVVLSLQEFFCLLPVVCVLGGELRRFDKKERL